MSDMDLTAIVRSAFEATFPSEDFSQVKVVPATDPKFGDYQCNDALKVAKKVGLKPRDAAMKVAENIGDALKVEVEIGRAHV